LRSLARLTPAARGTPAAAGARPAPGRSPFSVFKGTGAVRRIALFGGTFDPIHAGHLAVARAAERRFGLHQIYFIPTGRPPHKQRAGMAPFADRYAMVALSCADHPRFSTSLVEAGADRSGRDVCYSVDTVRYFRQKFRGKNVHLYFLLGADSFLQFPTWKDYLKLLGLCDFIVASRPGFRVDALRRVIPSSLIPPRAPIRHSAGLRAIQLRHTTVYLLDTVASEVSATQVRGKIAAGESIRGLVPPRVEEYITKQALYR